jgi:hypothetical protein
MTEALVEALFLLTWNGKKSETEQGHACTPKEKHLAGFAKCFVLTGRDDWI